MVKNFPLEMSAESTVLSRNLLCYDARSPEIATLAAHSQVPVVALADDMDLLSQISRHARTGDYDRLHLLAHGQRDMLVLGHTLLDVDYLQRHARQLATWKLSEIVLWSCSVGANGALVRELERLTGARVLASDASLGMTAEGVNWTIRDAGVSVALPFAASAAETWPHQLPALLFSRVSYLAEDTRAAGSNKADLESNSLKLVSVLNQAEGAVKYLFTSDPASDPIYSGNNVRGTLYAINSSNAVVGSYYGEMSRLVKSGSTVQAGQFYVYPSGTNTSNPATTILVDFGVATAGTFAVGNSVRTSSDPVDSGLNKLIPAPQPPSGSADSDNAYEQGGASNNLSDAGDGDAAHPNASGNVLSNDSSGITSYSIVSNMLVSTTSTGITVNQVTSQLSGATGSPAASSTSVSNGLAVAGRYGTLTIGQDGSYVYDVDDANSAVQALRLSSNTLTETFTYTLANSRGLLDTETLSITIKGINDYPDANNDYNYAKESIEALSANQYAVSDKLGRKATGNVLDNDTDVDANSEEEFVVGYSLTGNATGSSQGAVTYTTVMNSSSASSLKVSDVWYVYGLSSDGLTTTPLYHADGTTRVTVASRDGSGTNLSFTFSDSTNLRSVTKFLISTDSTTPLTSAGTDYTGTINSSTAASSTTVNVSGLTGSIAVGMTIGGTNLATAPTVSALNYTSGTLTSITVSSAVAVDAASLSFTATGTLGSDLQGQHGVLRLAANGSYTYTPTANNVGLSQGQTVTEVFNYTMRDAAGSSNTSSRDSATLTISVQGSGSNDPVAIADSATGANAAVETGTAAGSTATGNLLSNDLETATATAPGSMTVKAARAVGSASETVISGATTVNGQYGSVSISPNGDWTYTPNDANATVNGLNASQTLVDMFYYRAGNTLVTGTSATTLTVEIKGANDAPTAGNDAAVAVEDQFNPSGSVLLNDSDVDNADTRTVTSAQAGSSTSFGAEDAVAVGSSSASNGLSLNGTYGTLVLGADGTYQYTVNNSNTSVQGLKAGDTPLQDQFVYEITDSAGAKATATLTVSIKGSDDAPVNTLPASLSTEQGTALAINGANLISVADVDNNLESVTVSVENGTLAVTAVGGAGEATLTGTSGTASFTINGTRAQINAALATLSYTPATSFSGTDYLTVYSLDGSDLFDVDSVAITVTGAVTVSSVTAEDSANLGQSDSTVVEGGTLKYSVAMSGASGNAQEYTFALSGTAGASDYEGIANFTFSDGVTYDAGTQKITVPAGVTSFSVLVDTTDDSSIENAETLIVTIGGVAGTGNITDNDSQSISSVTAEDNGNLGQSDSTVVEGGTLKYSVSLSGASPNAEQYTFALSGTAASTDYEGIANFTFSDGVTYDAGTGKITVPAGVTSFSVLVDTTDDSSIENAETLIVTIGGVAGTGNITDNDSQSISSVTAEDNGNLGQSDSTVVEGGTLKYSVSLSAASPNAEQYTFALSGTAGASDYEGIANFTFSDGVTYDAGTGKITVPAGVTSFSVLVDTTDDSSIENAETLIVTIGGVAGTGNITDNDSQSISSVTAEDNANLGQSDSTVVEGGTLKYSVSLSAASPNAEQYTFALSGTAASTDYEGIANFTFSDGVTYDAGTQKITVPAGVTSFSVLVDTTDDSTIENAETLIVTIGGVAGTGNITDNDVQSISSVTAEDNANLGQSDSTVVEGGTLKYSVSLSGASPNAEQYTFALSGTAASTDYEGIANFTFSDGVTYDAGTGKITVPAGVTSFSVLVDTTDDSSIENAETLIVTIGGVAGTGNITDNDSQSISSVTAEDNGNLGQSDSTVVEGGTLKYSVSLSAASPNAEQYTFALSGTAASTDYEGIANFTFSDGVTYDAGTQKITVPAGVTSFSVLVDTTDDSTIENAETLIVTIGGVAGTGNITDNDEQSVSSVTAEDNANPGQSDSTVEEGGTLKYTVTLNAASPRNEEHSFTLGGTAGGSDHESIANFSFSNGVTYDSTTGKITVPAGVTSFTVLIDTVDDSMVEASETLQLSVGSKSATGTITDNDTAGLVLGTVSGNTTEAGGTATFTVKLACQPTSDVTMSVSSSDTTEGTVTQTLTFTAANWNTTQTVTVTGADDLLVDGNVAYQALLSTSSSDSNYNNRTGAADITNTDDDVQTITVTPPANKVSEGSVAPFTVTLGKVATSATVVTLTLGSDSDAGTANATSGTDYSANLLVTYKRSSDNTVVTETVASGGTVSLAAGETSFKVLASTSADSPRVFEGDEVFTFTAAITGASDTRAVTISDDGSGTVYKNDGSVDAEASKDDDRPSIASVSVVDANNRSATPADTSVVEGGTLEFTVTLSNASLSATQFALNVGGTALVTDYGDLQFSNGVTYNSETGRLSVPAGVTSFTVTVATVDDAVIENAKTLILDVGGVSATGTITDNDEPPPAPAPAPAPTPTPPPAPVIPTPEPEPLPFGADLDPRTDTSGGERITRVIEPEFTINAAGRMASGDTAILLDPQGAPIGSAVVTPDDVSKGTVNVPTIPLDDGVYTFIAQIRDENGNVKGEAPVVVTIITDRDGIAPSVELAANGGDYNQDGVPDWEQNNVAQLPVTSLAAFQAGRNAPASSFGAIMVGDVPTGNSAGPVQLNNGAQLLDLALVPEPLPLPAGFTASTPTFQFSVTSEQGKALNDIAPDVPGLQTRVVIELPQGVRANVYKKFDPKSGSWVSLMDDQSLDTFDEGATLIDRNGDGLIDRIVVTLTDGGAGDEDGIVNGVIVDPGLLAFQAPEATPVFSVLLANGDRYYSTEASEAARMAKGTGNVFEGVRFDSLATVDGGRQIDAHRNFITGDWYFAADGQPMPYACYEEQPGAGFQAAAQGRGPGVDFHLWLDRQGTTQLVSTTEAAQLGLAAKGYRDLGAVFNTTTNSAFQFDVEGYLVSNADNASVRQLVSTLAGQYSRSSDAGFIEAVESHYLQQVDLVGLPRMSNASAADLNALYGTGFGA